MNRFYAKGCTPRGHCQPVNDDLPRVCFEHIRKWALIRVLGHNHAEKRLMPVTDVKVLAVHSFLSPNFRDATTASAAGMLVDVDQRLAPQIKSL